MLEGGINPAMGPGSCKGVNSDNLDLLEELIRLVESMRTNHSIIPGLSRLPKRSDKKAASLCSVEKGGLEALKKPRKSYTMVLKSSRTAVSPATLVGSQR